MIRIMSSSPAVTRRLAVRKRRWLNTLGSCRSAWVSSSVLIARVRTKGTKRGSSRSQIKSSIGKTDAISALTASDKKESRSS